jgi:hypothetical protein
MTAFCKTVFFGWVLGPLKKVGYATVPPQLEPLPAVQP